MRDYEIILSRDTEEFEQLLTEYMGQGWKHDPQIVKIDMTPYGDYGRVIYRALVSKLKTPRKRENPGPNA